MVDDAEQYDMLQEPMKAPPPTAEWGRRAAMVTLEIRLLQRLAQQQNAATP